MSWFQVDDGFFSHPKVLSIPRSIRAEALGTWTLLGTWSASKLTDGKIPAYMIEEIGGTVAGADALVDARLWSRRKGVYSFTKWDKYQLTREQVEHRREAERSRKAEWRAKNRENPGESTQSVPRDTSGIPTPLPSSSSHPMKDQDLSDRPPLVDGEEESYQHVESSVDNSLPAVVVEAVRKHTDRTINVAEAWDVMEWVMKRRRSNAEPIKLPFRYYPAAILKDQFEIQQWLDERAK